MATSTGGAGKLELSMKLRLTMPALLSYAQELQTSGRTRGWTKRGGGWNHQVGSSYTLLGL